MVELLSPVGDFETLRSAIKAGCNSIYFGIKGLNMRSASARNFDIKELKEVADICHESNVKCYLTLNTVVYNHEFPRLEKILDELKAAGVDGIIAADMGVIQLANEKEIEVHISTQASVANVQSARFYSKFSPRLVLARECTLAQIKSMKEELMAEGNNVEFEVFIHGALCVAESGRCFMSQHHNRISANRGQCHQECRKQYKITDLEDPRREFILDNQFVMSPKDLCALPILDKLIDAHIDVFKIEGRAKGPEYVYHVTKVYREAIDAIEAKTFTQEKVKAWLEVLESVYNRGLHDNFLLGTPTNDSWSGIYGSRAKTIKKIVGRITHYFSDIGVAEAEIFNETVKVGEKFAITGETTGFVEGIIEEMRDDNGPVKEAKKIVVAFKVPQKVRENDKLFIIEKKTTDPEKENVLIRFPHHEPFKTTKKAKPMK